MRKVYSRNPNRWLQVSEHTAVCVDTIVIVRRINTEQNHAAIVVNIPPDAPLMETEMDYDDLLERLDDWDADYDYSDER
jgi:hypothetical protein